MAGTLLLLGRAGFECHYMTIANGNCGSVTLDANTLSGVRRRESEQAAAVLGATFHPSLVGDMEVMYEVGLLRKVAAVVREVEPVVLLLHSPVDYVEDHQNAARLGVSAAFSRAMRNFATTPPREPFGTDLAVYHAQPHGNVDLLGAAVRPSICVDISDVIEQKAQALACHVSQQEWLDTTQGMDSYVDSMKTLSSEVGRLSGQFAYAEGWRKRCHQGLSRKEIDPLADVLRDRVLRWP
jgi:LmbE family N-acetylglucosaminyl deacetylase